VWYDGNHNEAQFIQGWKNLLARYSTKVNLMGIDIKNEPHGMCAQQQQ
jgi:aryl-phospho-beta-D-glucosidase BglC (GH1 family)